MIVVGGTYREACASPEWSGIRGSGYRAAMALRELDPEVRLHTYAPAGWVADLKATLNPLGIELCVSEINETFEFDYWYALMKEYASGSLAPSKRYPPLEVTGEVVLAFGMLEGSARVTADRVVYDPRTSHPDASFGNVGVKAGELAYVIQHEDLMGLYDLPEPRDPRDAAGILIRKEGAAFVVSRHPFGGATVYVGERPGVAIPCHAAETWFRIGEGDVFAAAFAYWWGVRRRDPVAAATIASRSAAFYNDGPDRSLPPGDELAASVPVPRPEGRWTVYLSGPGSTMAERWLAVEARRVLEDLGADVVAAFPKGSRSDGVQCDWSVARRGGRAALLALGDARHPLTNVHVGYAKARGLPVVLLCESDPDWERETFLGTRCEIAGDLASAVYRACLACWRTVADDEAAA